MKEDERIQQPTTLVEEVSSVIIADGDDQKQSTQSVIQDTTADKEIDVASSTIEGPAPLKKAKLAEPSGSLPEQDANPSAITGPAAPTTSVSPPATTTTVDAAASSPTAAPAAPNPPADNDTSASTTKSGPDPSTKSSTGPSLPEALPLSAAAASSSTTSVSAKHPSADTSTDSPAIATTQSSQLLPDYATVRQTVHDMLALLQTYGPLTEGQLEYNLPSVGQQHQNNADDATFSTQKWKVSDVLELLVALGLVQKVDHSRCANKSTKTTITIDPPVENADSPPATTTTTTTTSPTTTNHPPIVSAPAPAPAPPQQYCVFGGVPRADVVLPSDVMADITAAHREAARSWQRSRVLKKALLNTWSTKTVLEQLLKEFPEIGNDPVYRAALRNCHVSIGDSTTASSKRSSSKRAGDSKKSKTNPKLTATATATTGALQDSALGPSPASIAAVATAKVVQAQKQSASQQRHTSTSSDAPVTTVPTPPVSTTTTLIAVPVPTAVSAAPSTCVQPPPEAVAAAIKHSQLSPKISEESSTKPEMNTSPQVEL